MTDKSVNTDDVINLDDFQTRIVRDITFFQKYKGYIVPGIMFLVGALGGNVDRAGSLINTVTNSFNVDTERVNKIEARLDKVEDTTNKIYDVVKGLPTGK